ncbi:hypothetical protein BKK81_33805 (plasmid) [Cupriavidus sp. USMAHM13]|uniref:hypothetical protein n=1 Tax=Cupriavidus sp. USMAHM13 TaxID=1389192 RepID=UPI0008A6CEC1|nr:hypothetical protein [Cupriavidus sp. USMAHM13]AOZ04346.1 hypothetical protein BKK81_33805 [Cupriavidus sp. USMAHM13]
MIYGSSSSTWLPVPHGVVTAAGQYLFTIGYATNPRGQCEPVARLAHRENARALAQPTIAPKHLSAEVKTLLPVLHATRDGRSFTALYSDTMRAYELGRTGDWVVLYFYDDAH